MRANIQVVDTTLRDGEQAAGKVFSADEKLCIAQTLDRAGVRWIEAGTPAMGEEEQASLRRILAADLKAAIFSWNRACKEDILASVQCGFSVVHISIPVSDYHIKHKLKKDRAWVILQLQQAVRLAKSFGCSVSVGAEDASRADREFFLEVAEIAAHLGATRIRFADTVGALDPFSTYAILAELVARCALPIEMHAHNDFGLATANTLAACRAGAAFVSTTIGGIGERAGNAAMEEVAAALQLLADRKIDISRSACQEAAALIGERFFPYKPIVGAVMGTREDGYDSRYA